MWFRSGSLVAKSKSERKMASSRDGRTNETRLLWVPKWVHWQHTYDYPYMAEEGHRQKENAGKDAVCV